MGGVDSSQSEGSHLLLSKPHQDAVVTGAGLCAAPSGHLRGCKKEAFKETWEEAFKTRSKGRMRCWLSKVDSRKHEEVHGQWKMRLLEEGCRRYAVRVPNAQVLLQEVR